MVLSDLRSLRQGFTLVELMVAAAVSVIIMAILSTVFQTGIDTLRDMRSVGHLQDQLRAAIEILRRDLQADHFLPRDADPNSHKQISGARLSQQILTDKDWQPPLGGFFHIESTQYGSTVLPDADGLSFTTQLPHHGVLHFTSILPGNKPQNLYSANVGPQTYFSPAAEILYYVDTSLAPNHRLIRRQRLVARTDLDRPLLLGANDPEVVACIVPPFPSSTPQPLTLKEVAARRMLPAPLGGARAGDDVLLANVKLFEVKVSWDVVSPSPTPPVRPFNLNSDFPFDFLDGNGGLNRFDTGDCTDFDDVLPGEGNANSRIRVKALQIRLRIYDPLSQTSRQVTIVQDM